MIGNLPQNPRILVTRLSAIGDCVHTIPMIWALRDKFPTAHIVWATQNAGAQIVEGLDCLDEVLRIDRNWLKRLNKILATRAMLRRQRFDVVLDPQSLTKSSLLGWLSGASIRIGFASGQGRELSPWLSTVRVKPNRDHVVDRYLELLTPLGIENPKVTFSLPPRPVAAQSVNKFLSAEGLVGHRFALLNPGAGWNSKLWPHQRYADVAEHLNRRHGIKTVVLWAGDREKLWAQDIVGAAPTSSVLAPDTTLQELAEICRAATLFVGSDTGPLHIAAAVGTSTVAMYGPTKISVCGPYATTMDSGRVVPHEPLQVRLQNGSSRERRGDDNRAMREISVNAVTAACDRLLSALPQAKVA